MTDLVPKMRRQNGPGFDAEEIDVVALREEELLIEETEPNDDDEAQDIRYEIATFPTDFTVQVMYEKWESGQIVIPDYQRRYVWTLPQASRLIESFLLGLPIPQVFLFREHSKPELYVVDGHQRLATIAHFYRGTFPGDREFRLRGVRGVWANKAYEDLSEDDRTTLNDATLRSIIIRQILPDDSSSVYQIFERLNTGGTQLNPMEIRRAISRGSANDFLDRLNTNQDWRALIGKSEPDPRFRDQEMLLRVLALSNDWRNYSKPMKTFITAYMKELDNETVDSVAGLGQRFAAACSAVREALGDIPFHLRQRINLAALDSVMATAVEAGGSIQQDWANAFEELKTNPTFVNTVTYNTSDTSVVQQRIELVRNAFSVSQ